MMLTDSKTWTENLQMASSHHYFCVWEDASAKKTMEINRSYHAFDPEHPRLFKANEIWNRRWQSDLFVITHAVYVDHPWTNFNNSNFGNEHATKVACLSRFDVFTSKKETTLGS